MFLYLIHNVHSKYICEYIEYVLQLFWSCPTYTTDSHKKKENLSWIQYNNQYKKFQIAVWTDCFVFWLKNTSLLLVCDYGFIDLRWVLIFTLNCTFYLLLLKTLANKLT